MNLQLTSHVSTVYTSAALANLSRRLVCDQRHAVDESASRGAGVKAGDAWPVVHRTHAYAAWRTRCRRRAKPVRP